MMYVAYTLFTISLTNSSLWHAHHPFLVSVGEQGVVVWVQ